MTLNRQRLRSILLSDFYNGVILNFVFVFFKPFAGTCGGVDYEKLRHLCATLPPVGFWLCVSHRNK